MLPSALFRVYGQCENEWRPYHYNEGDMVELTSLAVSFPFDAVYRRINLA